MPSDERKGTRFMKARNQKRGQSQARKRHRTYTYLKEERGGTGYSIKGEQRTTKKAQRTHHDLQGPIMKDKGDDDDDDDDAKMAHGVW